MALGGLLCGTGTGCRLFQQEATEAKSLVQSLARTGGAKKTTNSLEILQSEVMRMADLYVASVAQASDEFRAEVPTPEGRLAALQWKLLEATAAYINASGENPVLNAVDLAVLANMSLYAIENQWIRGPFGARADPLLKAHRQLEQATWEILDPLLSPEQLKTLRELVDEYHHRFPNSRFAAGIRLPELATSLGWGTDQEASRRGASLLSLLYMDPFAGLDPATIALQQTRLLAQRAMYYGQRMPMLLGWQVELTTYQIAGQPESRDLLQDLNRASEAAIDLSRSAQGLPEMIRTEREAALDQFFSGLARERAELVRAMESQESTLRELMPQARQTLEAGDQTATALNTAIQSLDAFVRYVSTPDPTAPPDTNSRPFDVRDYGTAAVQIGAAARDLNVTLESLNRTVPAVSALGDRTAADLRSVVTHAFRLVLVLILAAGIVAALVLRFGRRPA